MVQQPDGKLGGETARNGSQDPLQGAFLACTRELIASLEAWKREYLHFQRLWLEQARYRVLGGLLRPAAALLVLSAGMTILVGSIVLSGRAVAGLLGSAFGSPALGELLTGILGVLSVVLAFAAAYSRLDRGARARLARLDAPPVPAAQQVSTPANPG